MTVTAPGLEGAHTILDDPLRHEHGDKEALELTLWHVHQLAVSLLANWPAGSGARVHFLMTLEPPARQERKP